MTRPVVTPCADMAASTPALFLPVTSPEVPLPRRSTPGLGIVPDSDDGTGLSRYSIVHLGSGLAVFGAVTARCGAHVREALDVMRSSGLDWEQPAVVLSADERLGVLRRDLLDELGLCFDPETGRAVVCLSEWLYVRRAGGAR
jgi:hypothetical protein